ncbi:hypothetical protein ESA_00140 [Cronobacter sakazakii ATCC BAA-894]|uniref:Uncharacterized protein n=1 Tax=Cronobacter sakazakii (strain ATCC BAA-894) TaxID=290339 RepID=A7MMD2_CROS8|nr:hypothetical protein ESA_00140 [Cronobacter sakazakii ATCC BAA-894]
MIDKKLHFLTTAFYLILTDIRKSILPFHGASFPSDINSYNE